ncbi:MMPL family transporter [Rossellomorea vietnamensis]|uniref:MMPL family transporter n=1 Tax=Rossellomorea vietnamensis TaxID=218284 RepID=A0A5D4NYS0_9BACI|nr:MMPL family transporter [Rossellomorea vietnamensis]TYS18688.1 MMPL family transporter [Rossellomorea vietnamensis]
MKSISNKITKFYKAFLAFWVILAIGLGYFAIGLPGILGGDGFRTDGEFEKVNETLSDDFDFPENTLLLLFQKKSESETDFEREIESILGEIDQSLNISGIQSPLEDESLRKGDTAYAALTFDQPNIDEEIDSIKEAIADEENVILTGGPVISADINKASQDDLKRAELIGLPVALLVLLFAFGSIIASIVPIIIGAITVISSFGILTLLGGNVELSVFLLNVVPMIGLALSIDFALLFINRYREELLNSDKLAAIKTTIQTAGRSIIFSAVCVFIGLAAMSVIDIDIFQTIAIGGMVVVSIAVISSLTLLPAVLILLGPAINKWMVIKRKEDSSKGWRAFARFVMKRPLLISVSALAILVIGILPVGNMNLSIPDIDSLPESYESRQAIEIIQDTFNTHEGSQVYVIAERPGDWTSEEGLKEMERLASELEEDGIVDSVNSIYTEGGIDSPEALSGALQQPETQSSLAPLLDSFISGEKLLLPLTLSEEESSEAAKDWIRDWSSRNWDYSLSFGGEVKFNQEIFDEIYDKVALSIGIILISTYIILMIAFQSIIIPLKAILMNIIGLTSTFGILVWLFQGGHFGLQAADIALVLPVLVFSLVFGLSMDYEVFLISRIHEIYLQTGDNTHATIEGLTSTSKIITSAALIMMVITGAFAFTGVMPVKQIGLGIAIAIFIDATIIRMLLVPSLMKLLGDWNWYMPFSKKNNKAGKSGDFSA